MKSKFQYQQYSNDKNDHFEKIPEKYYQLIVALVLGEVGLFFKNSRDKINGAQQQPDKRNDQYNGPDTMYNPFETIIIKIKIQDLGKLKLVQGDDRHKYEKE